jgi:hypothetical protein
MPLLHFSVNPETQSTTFAQDSFLSKCFGLTGSLLIFSKARKSWSHVGLLVLIAGISCGRQKAKMISKIPGPYEHPHAPRYAAKYYLCTVKEGFLQIISWP